MRVYLDSVLIIYLVDQNPTFGPLVKSWLTANPCDLVSSELGRLESLVLPVRVGDAARISAFETFFHSAVQEMVPFTRAVYDRAVQIRASTKFKTRWVYRCYWKIQLPIWPSLKAQLLKQTSLPKWQRAQVAACCWM